ncbi:eamA-like transporter family protein [Burkholderia gladioli]|uniref:EamA-like transporter family protein n=1 Tax=Burkholderia gladioli TaxID=28095 RepID=A0AAW3EWN5_BURGA|nr:DMT family transporter [Burkholderia gladioli]AJW95000.1 eamA-like transporter family protein [Burkholderia gladioli]ASD83885.1 EamA family transporter [Burkholderia gladioli pv. gladioli]AWY51307.1 EamA family transporter [Burkholderia gladioli pv. gladioli]KGC12957.1 eamA-like transporter family protein [Burkholderia gladioli]SPU84032.1 drug/metabolite transporter permease [Burkholderia gladioli]
MSTIQSQSQSPSAGPRGTARAAGAVAFTVLSWASAFPFIRIGLHELSPMQLAAARFATAAVLVLGWLAWRRPRRPTARDAMAFALSGLLGIAGYNALLNTAELSVAPGAAAFIMSTSPIVTAILSTLFLREKLNRQGWAGSLFSFAGIGLIASGQPGGLALGSGTTLILLAAAGAAVYFVLQRRLIPVYGPLACTAYTLLAGAVLLLGIFPAALGYASWTFALSHFGPARATHFLYLVPAAAMGLSIFMTGERPGLATLGGGLMAIAGVAAVALRGRSSR